jgi:hypothetical protein
MEESFGAQAGAVTREENNVCGDKSFRAWTAAGYPIAEQSEGVRKTDR